MGDYYNIGGYGSTSSGLPPEKLRVQSATFRNYVEGTVGIVFLIFITFIIIQIMTLFLMAYARHLKNRKHKPGFYDPPPAVPRYGGGATYKNGGSNSRVGTLRSTSDYSGVSTNPMSLQMPRQHVASAMSMESHRTATSTML